MSRSKPFTFVALIISAVTIYLNWYWPWGLLLFWWVYQSRQSGETYFVEDIKRGENPVLFWIILAMWAAFGVIAILYDVFPGQFEPG
ncbi:MAG: hypothetical protein JKY49_06215 [Cohaesibacteraceae bacterium]|nr:hypothetical protein [Cohaesibacteraceae bacterium]MBL4875453.1 hypothetical protein [Cohaesibacteraceae bacterium]